MVSDPMLSLALAIASFSFTIVVILGLKMQHNERQGMLRFLEQQKVIGGLPPEQWSKQLTLEERRVGIEETKLRLAEAKFIRDQGKEDELFKIDLEQRKVSLKRAEAAATRDEMKGGGRGVFGS